MMMMKMITNPRMTIHVTKIIWTNLILSSWYKLFNLNQSNMDKVISDILI